MGQSPNQTTVILNSNFMPARNCKQLYDDGFRTSGLYNIMPRSSHSATPTHNIVVYCDMSLQGGGWTVIQRRVDGTINFNRYWVDYKMGFGNLKGNFWLGLDNIVLLTNDVNMELYVGLSCFGCSDVAVFAKYSQFSLAPEWPLKYQLQVSGYEASSTVGDSFTTHNGQSFSTPDKDNDASLLTNCAQVYSSGWWFNGCYNANLNGVYQNQAYDLSDKGIQWNSWLGKDALMQSAVLAVRPL
ncbi:hypothetical protein EMCRGX_G023326 [Ephydatia muelleri]